MASDAPVPYSPKDIAEIFAYIPAERKPRCGQLCVHHRQGACPYPDLRELGECDQLMLPHGREQQLLEDVLLGSVAA